LAIDIQGDHMKTLTLAFALIAAAVVAPASAAAADKDNNNTPTTIPIVGTVRLAGGPTGTGTPFNGTFNLTRFANQNGALVAIGTVTGTLTDPQTGKTSSFLQTVAMPVAVNPATATTAAGITAAPTPAAVAAAVCSILHLDLGPLTLNVLGLQIDLSEVVLDITAIPGNGNLLGNLLCSVANLLNNTTGLANLLNQILALL